MSAAPAKLPTWVDVGVIPLINLVIMPVAVCGATSWWVSARKQTSPQT